MNDRDPTKHLPGPWYWNVNLKSRCVRLESATHGLETVMDFVRWGMMGAKPRFQRVLGPQCGIMVPVEEWAIPVKGREHHASWFQAINHPDARLIAAAPDLLHACRMARAFGSQGETDDGISVSYLLDEAIRKATGQTR